MNVTNSATEGRAEPLEVPRTTLRRLIPDRSAATFRALSADHIVDTADTLGRRIDARFPRSGLSEVAQELRQVAVEAADVAAWLARPHYWLRLLGVGLTCLLCGGVITAVLALRVDAGARSFSYW